MTRSRVPLWAGRWAPAAVVLLALAVPAGGAAQEERSRDRPDRAELEERVRARFAELVKRRLGLTDEQERVVADVVATFQDDRRALGRRQRALRRRVRALDLDDRPREVEPAQAQAVLQEMVAVRAEEVRLFRAEQEALLRVLTPVQVLQFHDLREDMADRIRKARGGRRGGDDHGRGDDGRRSKGGERDPGEGGTTTSRPG